MRAAQLKAVLPRELLASVVVFLVALPLCMGIAIASGMPPAKGLITGIIGGLVVGWICSVMASPEDKNVRKSRAVYHQKCDGFNDLTTFVVFTGDQCR